MLTATLLMFDPSEATGTPVPIRAAGPRTAPSKPILFAYTHPRYALYVGAGHAGAPAARFRGTEYPAPWSDRALPIATPGWFRGNNWTPAASPVAKPLVPTPFFCRNPW